MKSTKKTLVISVICLMLCASLFVGATFAWFTDSVTSGVNQIVAGNLDVEVLHTNAHVTEPEKIDDPNINAMFTDKDGNAILWEPGAVSYETFTVQNVGTLALKYGMAMNILDYNTVVEADGNTTEHNLSEVLKVMVLRGNDKLESITRDTVSEKNWSAEDVKTLAEFEMNSEGTLYPESDDQTKASSEEFQVIVYWDPTESDNTWNLQNGKYASDARTDENDTTSVGRLYINFGVVLKATQVDYENDSFNNTYDKDLLIGDIGLTNIDKTETIAKTSTNPIISSDAKKDGKPVVEVTLPASVLTLDSNDVNLNVYRDDAANGNFKAESSKEGSSIDLTGKDTVTYEVNVTVNGVEVTSTESLYEVKMFVGKNRINLEMYHKNAKMTNSSEAANNYFTYNKDTGFVTMYVDSFSPFTSVFLDDGDASDGLHYHKGVLYSGTCSKDNLLYENGAKVNGLHTDGKYYKDGKLGNGFWPTEGDNRKYYVDGVLANGKYDGITYVDGVGKSAQEYADESTLITGTIDKGELVTIDNRQYRILSVNGTEIKALAMSKYIDTAYNATSTTIDYDGKGSLAQKYADSTLDNVMTTFYNSLPQDIKQAIVPKDIKQSVYKDSGGSDVVGWYKSSFNANDTSGNKYSLGRVGEVNVGTRYVYALDMDDIVDYLGTSITPQIVNTLFWNKNTYLYNKPRVWLRTSYRGGMGNSNSGQAFAVTALNGRLDGTIPCQEVCEVRPVFVLDLSLLNQ